MLSQLAEGTHTRWPTTAVTDAATAAGGTPIRGTHASECAGLAYFGIAIQEEFDVR